MSLNFNEVQLPSNRRFGLFFAFVFLIASFYFYSIKIEILYFLFGASSILFFIISFLIPHILKPLNKMWMILGMILGMIVSPIVMGFIFFILFSPIGILMKFFGRDTLLLRLNSKKSYWVKKNNTNQSNSFRFQF